MSQQSAVIADTALVRGAIRLKHAAMLYDRVVVLRTRELKEDPAARGRDVHTVIGRDADWLLDSGLVEIVDDTHDEVLASQDCVYSAYRSEVHEGACVMYLLGPEMYDPFLRRWANGAARAFSIRHERSTGEACVPIVVGNNKSAGLLRSPKVTSREDSRIRESEVFSLVLRHIPVPDEETSWQQISEFREESSSREAYLDLRAWISELSKSDLTVPELSLKFERDLLQCKAAMRRHKIKCKFKLVQALVTAPLRFAENIVRLKVADAADALFSVGQANIDLMEAERSIAKRELRYLLCAQEALQASV